MAGARTTAAVLAGLPVLGIGLGQLIGADPSSFLLSGGAGGWLLVIGVALACCRPAVVGPDHRAGADMTLGRSASRGRRCCVGADDSRAQDPGGPDRAGSRRGEQPRALRRSAGRRVQLRRARGVPALRDGGVDGRGGRGAVGAAAPGAAAEPRR